MTVVAWLMVVVAGLFETGFAVSALISFGLLTMALKKLDRDARPRRCGSSPAVRAPVAGFEARTA